MPDWPLQHKVLKRAALGRIGACRYLKSHLRPQKLVAALIQLESSGRTFIDGLYGNEMRLCAEDVDPVNVAQWPDSCRSPDLT
jgi:hypothetical protein